MRTLVGIDKCPNCGGKLNKDRNILKCEYCDYTFKIEGSKDMSAAIGKADDGFIKTDWFDFQVQLKKLQRGPDSKKTLKSFNYCINELGTAEYIRDYISQSILPDYGLYAPGIKEDKLDPFLKRLDGKVTRKDNILFYANTGLFSSGKHGFILTDEKIVFSGKKVPELYYSELTEMAFSTKDDFVGIYLNHMDVYQMFNISSGAFTALGALAALIAALAFEENPGREKIIISEYKDYFDQNN